jgi:uncharacterized protein YndB with AHSA1/START domain
MTMETTDSTITVERTYPVPVRRVYDAWTRPELMVQWYCPNPKLPLRAEADVRIGGDWVLHMDEMIVRGSYTEVDEPRLIAFTWKWDFDEGPGSLVRVELTETDDGTRLLLTHSRLEDAEDVKNHAEGWEGCFARLPELL